MKVLARVTEDLEQPRGPDVMHSVQAPAEWFASGASIEVRLPRLLSCARCEGGGCDACGRRGAFEQVEAGIPELVEVTLPVPISGAPLSAVRLRLPGRGARDRSESALPNGHLLLTLMPTAIGQEAAALGLRRVEGPRALGKSSAGVWALSRALAKLLSRWLRL